MSLVSSILNNPRLADRCAELIDGRLGPVSPSAISAPQAHALSLDSSGLTLLSRRAGAIWHASTISRLVDGVLVRSLVAMIGAELRQVALDNLALAPAIPEGISIETMQQSIARDGIFCVSTWCAIQPAAVGTRIALRLPGDVKPQALHHEFGPAIIDALLTRTEGRTP